jgi:hypothetical protein
MKISNDKKKENTTHIYSSFLLNFTHTPHNYMGKSLELRDNAGKLLSCRNIGGVWVSRTIAISGAWDYALSPMKTRMSE